MDCPALKSQLYVRDLKTVAWNTNTDIMPISIVQAPISIG